MIILKSQRSKLIYVVFTWIYKILNENHKKGTKKKKLSDALQITVKQIDCEIQGAQKAN